jgi:putative flippase GtrA
MSLITNKKERNRFIKFGIVGILGSIVDFGVFNLLTIVFIVPSIAASVVSFLLAVINNFILNRIWTYPDSRNTPVFKQLTQFAIVSLAGLAIRIPLFAWMEKLLIPLAGKIIPNVLTPTIVGHNVALAFVIGVVMLWNFFANRLWTFKNVPA